MIDFESFQKYSLFGGFRPEDLELLRPLIRIARYAPDQTLIAENTPNDTVYFALDGKLRVSRNNVGIIELGAGDSFGEMEILDVMPAAATIRAITPVVAAELDRSALHRLYGLDAKLFALFMMNLARDLSRRLRRMDEKLCTSECAACRDGALAAAV